MRAASQAGAGTKAVSSALLFEVSARVLSDICSCTCEAISPKMAIPLKGWQGVISFEGPERGSVGVSMPAELAVILAGTMAGTDIGTSPGIQADAVGETANILSSSVLALLYGTRNHVQISSPVVSGDPADLASSTSSEVVSLGILVDEEFFVQVWLRVATPPGL